MASSLIQTSHTQLTRNIIKENFIELYEKKGLDKITVSEICAASGISRAAFYQHFDDKYSVLECICDEILTDLQTLNVDMHAIKIKNTDASVPLWVETVTYIAEKKKFIKPLICYPGEPTFVHRWNTILRNTIRRRLTADNCHQTKHLDLIEYSMASAIIGLYEYWFQFQPDLTPKEIAEIGSRLLFSSFYSFPNKL